MLDNAKTKQWTIKQRSWCVQRFFETRSFKAIREEFLHIFDVEKAPCKSRIQDWVKKFQTEGTVQNLNSRSDDRESNSGRKRLREGAIIERVRCSVVKSPKRSTRKRAQCLGLSRTTLRRILVDDLNLFPYRIQIHQKLSEADKIKRKEFAGVLMEKTKRNKSFLPLLWTSDEAHFHLDDQVISKNNIYWGSSRPDEVSQKPLHSHKVTVWCALSMKGIIGPLFFEENGVTVTVTKERYVKVLDEFWNELETHYKSYLTKFWFQQDGAPPHTANISIQWIKDHFKNRVVSKRMEIEWPSYSPDLSPPDFFLWGYLKDRVFKDRPKTIPELKEKIIEEIKGIKRSVLKSVMENLALRI